MIYENINDAKEDLKWIIEKSMISNYFNVRLSSGDIS